MPAVRQIIHCDCDCFYASIEMRDNPGLRGKPLAVGGSPQRRGVIATCNYEARKFGVHSAMASATARKRCPDLIIIRPDMDRYRAASARIHRIFQRHTPIIEPLSLDEAYLDVSACQGQADLIAEAIRNTVRETVGITLSVGIAANKFLAKIASDWNKPDGQFTVQPQETGQFLASLPVHRLPGVGKVTAAKMHRLGITTCGELRQLTGLELDRHFGSFGHRLLQLSQGVDERPVQPERIRKSISVENTYAEDLPDLASCLGQLPRLEQQLAGRMQGIRDGYCVKKQFVKIKFHDFVQTTVEMLSETVVSEHFASLCRDGFRRGDRPVRLLGLGVKVAPVEATARQGVQLAFALDQVEP